MAIDHVGCNTACPLATTCIHLHLTQWHPVTSHSGLCEAEQDYVKRLLSLGWDESILTTYSSGLLIYHIKEARAPISSSILTTFVTALAGSYSSSAIINYISGICAWHILHGLKWSIKDEVLEKAKQIPFTLDIIASLRSQLDFTNHVHVAIYAYLMTSFYAIACLGELTASLLGPGEDIYWSAQTGITNPEAAYQKYLQDNNPPLEDHIFAYPHKGSFWPLPIEISWKLSMQQLGNYGIRISFTLKYLLRGLSFEAIKAKGC
ncbi:hypothetical protein P691DRAFT_792944 [Macrolepiota fuliginosa MF-IS2]|uniref:Uncharacterized protein n=1 Tax=Macrolepiota fuliginosa MF-IS2 TaxID=1400762 RepID=A0A9P6BVF1_9AGAR|nr:hypothetical protein P691DRAFT_792944 [Macrolepiota fuliginosa MF-IS2]